MRTTVALVAARPDTIIEDYARLLDLAGLTDRPRHLLVDAGREDTPGWAATPWQLDGVLSVAGAVEGPRPRVAALTAAGPGPAPAGRMWAAVLDRHGAAPADAGFLRLHRHQASRPHPALDVVLVEGPRLPVGLADAEALILAAPALRPGWGVAGACRLVRALVAGTARPVRGAPGAELTAEALAVVREHAAGMGAVLDGSLWGVARGHAHRLCAARNVLLAGRDPVAVDAVATRLAGADPLRTPWLRLCRDRGVGCVARDEIRVVGAVELLDLDFGLPADTFAAGRETPPPGLGGGLGRLVDRILARDGRVGARGTAWEKLQREYATGR